MGISRTTRRRPARAVRRDAARRPVALLLASLLGYAVSALSLRSVESYAAASALSVTQPGDRLAVPAANDELRSLAVTLNGMLERNEAAFERERRFAADASHESCARHSQCSRPS